MLEPIIPADRPHGRKLAALRTELRRRWCAETSFWPEEWTPDRPSLGQCAVTAMIVQDHVGGDILRTVNEGVLHYWNRVEGVDVDLTRDQFDAWDPHEEIDVVDRGLLQASGPTIAARYRRLAAGRRQLTVRRTVKAGVRGTDASRSV